MNNRAKIYTLYFAIDSLAISICDLSLKQNNLTQFDHQIIFNTIFYEANRQYYRLKKSRKSKILLVNFHADRALEKLKSRIENYLGELEDNNLDLICSLWITLDFALTRYFSLKADQSNLIYETEHRLRLGYNKYLSISKSSKFKLDTQKRATTG